MFQRGVLKQPSIIASLLLKIRPNPPQKARIMSSKYGGLTDFMGRNGLFNNPYITG